MKIRNYEFVSLDGKGLLREENGFTISEVEVLGQNAQRIVLKNEMFTCLERKKSVCFDAIDIPNIRLFFNDNCWGSGVKYYLYTFKHKSAATIKKEIESQIQEKLGYFMHGIDLSMIKEPANKEEK